MSVAACPDCGAELPDLASRCVECGASVRGRKRGELAGVRIDPERLDRALPDLALDSPSRRWGRASDRPEDGDDADARAALRNGLHERARTPVFNRPSEPPPGMPEEPPRRRTSSFPPPAPSSEPPQPRDSDAPMAAASLQEEPRELEPTPSPAAAALRPSQPPPDFPPLDAEVVVLYPAPPPEPVKPRASTTDSAPTSTHVRPPVLASEALLRDLAPAKPAPRALRYSAAVLGCVGLGLVALITGDHGAGVPFSVAFIALLLLSLPPMPYAARAASIVTVAGSGLVLVLSTEASSAARDESFVMTLAVTLLATGLYFRAFHRASNLARVLVALGVLVGVAFLQMSGALRHLTMFDTAWQSWAPRLLSLPFGLLLMLALLAFMDARTTGACSLWATCVLLFHALRACVQVLCVIWPKDASEPDLTGIANSVVLAWLCTPLFTALLSLGLAQILASTMAGATFSATLRRSQRPT